MSQKKKGKSLGERYMIKKPRAKFVPPGLRIVRSVICVWLCMLVYYLRGQRGEPFYSVIAAIQCVQPYSENMITEGRDRIIGTLLGAFWGAVILYANLLPTDSSLESGVMFCALLGIFTGLIIYSTVLLGIQQYALFSAVVFLGIAMYHVEDVNPYIHVINRTVDTIIGVGVAFAVNSVHLPRARDRETLFISGIDQVLFREDRNMTPHAKVELNNLLKEGMRFTVSTRQTPATVRELLADIDLRLPIIVMDGAALYDLNAMRYVRTVKMDPELVTQVTEFLHGKGMPFFTNVVKDNILVIYFKDYTELVMNEIKDVHHGESVQGESPDYQLSKTAYVSMERLYKKKRRSPYRNYVRTDESITEDVVYILVIDKEENVDRLHDALMEQPWASRIRTNFDTFDCEKGEKLMRIYAAEANRKSMDLYLQKRIGAPAMVVFGDDPDCADVIITDARGGQVIRELRRRFEPVSIRGWKNMFHL